ncbi:MAG: tetratricopeptide repeat protein [Candidatus Sumerlaeaceae bacterium]|nr:tetratricopeptide repeat protein [Candidatus Sumerlaeaceae bacterium]
MKRSGGTLLVCGVLVVWGVKVAHADMLTLRNGRQLTGAIVEESAQQITIRTKLGTLKIQKADVANVIRDGMLPQEVDADNARDSGQWNRAQELYRLALSKTADATAKSRLEAKLKEVDQAIANLNKAATEKEIATIRQLLASKQFDQVISRTDRLLGTTISDEQTSIVLRLKAEAHFGKYQHLADRMDHLNANKELEKCVAADETFYRAHLVLGERLLASAYTQEQGIKELLKGLRYGESEMTELERIKYHYLAGRALYQRGEFKEAASHFVECVRAKDKYPAYGDALDRAADCFVKMGEQTVLKNAQETVANLKRALELDPKKAQAWFLLGKLYRDLGETDKAADAFRTLIEVEPSFPYGHQFLALTYVDLKDYDKALQHLDEEIKQRPDNYQAYVDRAEVQIQLGNYDKADKDLEYVTSKDPGRWEAFMARARLAYVQEEYDKAKENIERALSLKQDAIEAHVLMGKILRAQKDLEGAKKWLNNVVEYLEQIPDLTFKFKTYLAEAQTQLAEIDLAQESPRQAETRLQIALENVPGYPPALARLGDVKKRLAAETDLTSRKKIYKEAESFYRQAIDADPKNPDFHLALGILYHKNLKDTAKAVENYKKYLQLGGKDRATVTKWIEECGGTVEGDPATTASVSNKTE